jgi:DNA-cytosine methyltransferase
MTRHRSADEPLVVGDLFCGAGGFSEGFRQAGFQIAWGVDNWPPAVNTFEKNIPGAHGLRANILSLDPQKLRDLGEVDVLIGSPPCIHFSAANRGGNGDRAEGLRLVRKFLTFVRELKPSYWVMENVAGMLPDLREEMFGQRIALHSGDLRIPRMEILDASFFGAPQVRRRSLSGNFPVPEVTHGPGRAPPLTLRSVLQALPAPNEGRPENPKLRIRDPVYEGFSVERDALRDHFEDTRWQLTRMEQRVSREMKIHNSVYGLMSYPDNIDRPSRTITATRTRGSRMTIVVPYSERGRRTLTLRESACAQGFPLDYQFWADSMSDRDVLVGNAVSPPVAFAIGKAILKAEGRPTLIHPILDVNRELAPSLTPRRIFGKRFSAFRRFRGVVGVEWRHDHRVELDNAFLTRDLPMTDLGVPPTDWRTRLYLGYAKKYRCYELRFGDGIALAIAVSQTSKPVVPESVWAKMLTPLLVETTNGFPKSTELQAVWTGRSKKYRDPLAICSSVEDLVLRTFPERDWKELGVPTALTEEILRPLSVAQGKEAKIDQPLPMSVRLLASVVGLTVICERLDNGVGHLDMFLKELTSGTGFLARMARAVPQSETSGGTPLENLNKRTRARLEDYGRR